MRSIRYEAAVKDCRDCPSRSLCTKSAWRVVSRYIDDDVHLARAWRVLRGWLNGRGKRRAAGQARGRRRDDCV
jgi:hypothetical protein